MSRRQDQVRELRRSAGDALLFAGRAVAWIAPIGTSRGSARIYIDGVSVGTVNLYSTTARGRQAVFARTFPSVGACTLRVVLLGPMSHLRVDIDGFAVLR